MAMHFSSKSRFIFIGDSITDCGRLDSRDGLGDGYVRRIRDYLCSKDPAHAPGVINVGISGNKVIDLAERWQADVLDLKPDLLSVKVGINDVWHGFSGNGVPIETFTSTYRDLLKKLKSNHPSCHLILCEPSVIWLVDQPRANEILVPYVKAVHKLAAEFGAEALVPLHEAFLSARRLRPDIDWTPDGVHPSSVGHMLIARTWLNAAGLL